MASLLLQSETLFSEHFYLQRSIHGMGYHLNYSKASKRFSCPTKEQSPHGLEHLFCNVGVNVILSNVLVEVIKYTPFYGTNSSEGAKLFVTGTVDFKTTSSKVYSEIVV